MSHYKTTAEGTTPVLIPSFSNVLISPYIPIKTTKHIQEVKVTGFSQAVTMLHAIISACWVDLQYGKKRDRDGREAEVSALVYTHSQFLSNRDVVHRIRQAPGGCAGLCVAPQGGPSLGPASSMSKAKGDLEV